MKSVKKPIRYAVVGQGWFGQTAILPAFVNAKENSELAMIFSGDAEKRDELSSKYKVPAHDYSEYERIMQSGDIDAVYIVTTNAQHLEYVIPAAKAGVHVLCEKPAETTAARVQQMIDICQENNVKLMIAYRLHFEEANLKAIEIAQSGKLGEVRMFNSTFTQTVVEGKNRLKDECGGGPLYDIGIYCINAIRYLFGDEPTEVTAFTESSDDPRFKEVPEMVSVSMRFPKNRLATFICGFDEAKVDSYRIVGTKGDLRLENGYGFQGDKIHHLTIDGKTETTKFKDRDHIGPEIVYFTDCILNDTEPEPNGIEGLIDVQIIEAIHESAAQGKPVKLGPFPAKPRPEMNQEIHKSQTKEPKLINASSPSEPVKS